MDLTEALQALLQVEDDEQLAEALNRHPELLSEEAIAALLDRARAAAQAGDDNRAAYLAALAEFLEGLLVGEQADDDEEDPLAEALEALTGVDSPQNLQRVFVEYPELLLPETQELLRLREHTAREEGDAAGAERWEHIADFLDRARRLLTPADNEETPPP